MIKSFLNIINIMKNNLEKFSEETFESLNIELNDLIEKKKNTEDNIKQKNDIVKDLTIEKDKLYIEIYKLKSEVNINKQKKNNFRRRTT